MAVIINQEMGADILLAAQDTAADYNERGVTYHLGGDASQGGSTSDCSHFVHDAIGQVGIELPYVTTQTISNSPDYSEIGIEDAFEGVVLVQGAHMGIYSGIDVNGLVHGWQMGNHGAANGKWGPGGWFDHPNDLRFYAPFA